VAGSPYKEEGPSLAITRLIAKDGGALLPGGQLHTAVRDAGGNGNLQPGPLTLTLCSSRLHAA
jgi:hypothetical protein